MPTGMKAWSPGEPLQQSGPDKARCTLAWLPLLCVHVCMNTHTAHQSQPTSNVLSHAHGNSLHTHACTQPLSLPRPVMPPFTTMLGFRELFLFVTRTRPPPWRTQTRCSTVRLIRLELGLGLTL